VRKSDLHPSLRATAVPVPGHSRCHAVVPPPVPELLGIRTALFPLARRELQILASAVEAAPSHAQQLLNMLDRREAVDSSQIEGTHTQFDELLLYELEAGTPDATADRDAEQTLNYLRAYARGVRQVKQRGQRALDTAFVQTLHRQLMAGDSHAGAGQFRQVQSFIGGSKMEAARFIPPPPSEVPRLMADLDRLLCYEPDPESDFELDTLARAPIVHAQFEAIHPFKDGNGRTGRLLLPLMFLADGGLPIHLAGFLKCRQQEYYDALLEVQMKLRWEAWVRLFLECTVAACRHTVHLLQQLSTIGERWRTRLEARRTRKHATVLRVAYLLLGHPVMTVPALVQLLTASFPAVNGAVAQLVEMDILRPKGTQRRNRAFHAHEVMNILHTGIDTVLADVATLEDYDTGR
jgi:Fic family protein